MFKAAHVVLHKIKSVYPDAAGKRAEGSQREMIHGGGVGWGGYGTLCNQPVMELGRDKDVENKQSLCAQLECFTIPQYHLSMVAACCQLKRLSSPSWVLNGFHHGRS